MSACSSNTLKSASFPLDPSLLLIIETILASPLPRLSNRGGTGERRADERGARGQGYLPLLQGVILWLVAAPRLLSLLFCLAWIGRTQLAQQLPRAPARILRPAAGAVGRSGTGRECCTRVVGRHEFYHVVTPALFARRRSSFPRTRSSVTSPHLTAILVDGHVFTPSFMMLAAITLCPSSVCRRARWEVFRKTNLHDVVSPLTSILSALPSMRAPATLRRASFTILPKVALETFICRAASS